MNKEKNVEVKNVKPALQQTQCTTQLPLVVELKEILSTIMSVEENQILGNYKEVRRLLLKSIFDLNDVIKRQIA